MSATRLKRRADGRYQEFIRYVDPTGRPRVTLVYDRDEAKCKEKAADVRQRLRNGEPAKDSRDRLDGFAKEWLSTTLTLDKSIKQSTKDWYSRIARVHIIRNPIGATRLDKVNVKVIEDWLLGLESHLSQSSVRGCYTTLHKILASAVKKELIRKNWADQVDRPSVEPVEARHLDANELAALLSAAKGSRYGLLFELSALTGIRRGEGLALKWADVRPKGESVIRVHGTLARIGGELTVTKPKTKNANRDLFIPDKVDGILKEFKQRQRVERLKAGPLWVDTGFVFTTELGQPCDPRNALRALKAAAKQAELDPRVNIHTLRHTAATLMLDAGIPILTVSRQLGHYSVSITGDIYGHVGEQASAEAMKALADAVNV